MKDSIAGLVAALLARLPLGKIVRLFKRTVLQMMPSLLAISFMVGLAYVTRYCGMDTIMGLSLTGMGWFYLQNCVLAQHCAGMHRRIHRDVLCLRHTLGHSTLKRLASVFRIVY
jgi:hypothetical protein